VRAALARAFAGTGASDALLDLFARHASLLLEENQRLNLTAIQEPDAVAVKHYLDVWKVLSFLDLRGRDVLDLGSGGGFPGIPLAASEPLSRFVLAEATERKAAFLERAVRELGLANAKVVPMRAEEWLRRNPVDLVLVRAGGSLSKLLRELEPVRRAFRTLVAMKGPRWKEEADEARAQGLLRLFPVEAVHEYDLPEESGRRALVVLRGARRG
jgi:16S rRNA (guanine527-N7)-methyltransferase